MLVATRSFISDDPYGEIRVIRGRTHIAEDSDLALRFPDAFRPAAGLRGPRDRISVAAGTASVRTHPPPRADLGREAWRLNASSTACTFQDRPGGGRIRLAASARQHLLELIARTTAVDHLEIGGMLIGPPPHAAGLLQVLRITEPGPAALREPDRYRPDLEHDLELADRINVESGGELAAIGTWHTHPRGFRSPSVTDLTSSSTWRSELLRVQRVVTLIAVPTSGGWDVEGFVTAPSFSRDVAVRATVT